MFACRTIISLDNDEEGPIKSKRIPGIKPMKP